MMSLCSEVLSCLQGKTLCTAESCTGGGIGQAITAVPGASEVFKGGIISYCNEVKHNVLGVDADKLSVLGPVSGPVAEEMAAGARKVIGADVGISVTGLAGPGGDCCGNPQGRVFIGYSDRKQTLSRMFTFPGNRDQVRQAAVREALLLIIQLNSAV